jgi:hypothetical protein
MQNELQNKLNFDNVYFRDLAKSVMGAFQDKIWWVNDFSDEARLVVVPFYYSMTGDESFLMDAFVDDVPGERVELNTDIIPRAHITITSVTAEFSKIRNPHVWMRSDLEADEEIYSIYSKVKAIPMSTTFDVELRLDSEIDVWKCYSKILDVFSLYKYMDFQHRGIYIEAVFALPEGKEISMPREQDLGSDSTISIKFPVEVKSYYPAIDLGYNGSLKEFQKLINGEEFITKPGVFGTQFHLANKRVRWNINIQRLDEEDIQNPDVNSNADPE